MDFGVLDGWHMEGLGWGLDMGSRIKLRGFWIFCGMVLVTCERGLDFTSDVMPPGFGDLFGGGVRRQWNFGQ